MDLTDLKLKHLGIDKNKLGKIYTFLDFGNMNHWFDEDVWGINGKLIPYNQRLIIDIRKTANFINLFSEKKWFYYGIDQSLKSSLHISIKAKKQGFKTVKKHIQWIKHYLNADEKEKYEIFSKNGIKKDSRGLYLLIPKCNFDVEICLDAIRFMNYYDTICLFSSDSDFARLLDYLKNNGKKVILVKGGRITSVLKKTSDILINSQQIKFSICSIKNTKKGSRLSGTHKSDPNPRAG